MSEVKNARQREKRAIYSSLCADLGVAPRWKTWHRHMGELTVKTEPVQRTAQPENYLAWWLAQGWTPRDGVEAWTYGINSLFEGGSR